MARTTKAAEAFYATVGLGQLAVDKARGLVTDARSFVTRRRKELGRTYGRLARRGRKVVKDLRAEAQGNRIVTLARERAGGATAGVRRALGRSPRKPDAPAKTAS